MTILDKRARVFWDTYSLPAGDMEWFLMSLMANRRDLPTVRLECGEIPRIAEPPIDAPELRDALVDALENVNPPQEGAGHPLRNRYVAAEAAYMLDVEARALRTGEKGLGVLDYLGTGIPGGLATEVITHARGSERSKTVRAWRDDGRRVLAALGAWPWAVVPEGKLARSWSWRRDPQFFAALANWHAS